MTNSNYSLVIQVSSSKFSFVTKNLLSQEVTYFGSEAITNQRTIEEQLESIFVKYPQLSQQFNQITVFHDNTLNTFIPKELFDSNNLAAYLQYNTKVFASDYFDHDYIEDLEIHNVYLPYVNLNNYFIDKFGSFTYKNINTELVDLLVHKTIGITQNKGFAYIQKDRFELIIACNGELVFFNSFAYTSAVDIVYFILFCFEQLELDASTTPLCLMGRVETSDPVFELLKRFIPHTEMQNEHAFISVDLLLHHQVPKQHYILFHS